MRLTYASAVDMAYVYLVEEIKPGQVQHTEPLTIDIPGIGRRLINLDFDRAGRLLGIEVDGARSTLTTETLARAPSDIP